MADAFSMAWSLVKDDHELPSHHGRKPKAARYRPEGGWPDSVGTGGKTTRSRFGQGKEKELHSIRPKCIRTGCNTRVIVQPGQPKHLQQCGMCLRLHGHEGLVDPSQLGTGYREPKPEDAGAT